MAIKASEVIAKPVVNRSAVSAIASAVSTAIGKVNATGSLLTQCVRIANQHYKGKAIPAHDIEAILSDLASKQEWKKGNEQDSRKSAYRSVLEQYAKLEEAMKALIAKVGHCTWHDGVALSRLLRTKNPKAAAAKHAQRSKKSAAVKPDKLTRAECKAEIAKFVKRMLKMKAVETSFRDSVEELCNEYSVKL